MGGAAEDAELDRLKDCAEADILARANLVGRFAPLVAEFCVRRCGRTFPTQTESRACCLLV